jgi:RHS repeat-associated protein
VGNRTRRTDANGVVTRYDYDPRNRLTNVTYPSGPGVVFDYDGNGNLTGLADGTGAAAFAYDALDRLTHSQRTTGLMAGAALDYAYDPVGNRTRVAYPDGRAVQYAYNANDWLTTVTDPQSGPTSYTRDDVGLPIHQANPNGTWTDYAYDPDDRLTHLFNGHPPTSSDVISSFDYTRDRVGNIQRTVERVTRGQVVTWDKRYTYDALYRLTNAVFTPDTQPYQVLTSAYSYDPVGNRLSQTTNIADAPNTPALPAPVTTKYSYNAANALLTASSPAGTTAYSYDANGNRTLMAGPGRVISDTYDFENRLSGNITYDVLPNGRWQYDSTLDYSYDGLGRRLERGVRDNGVRKTADFLYDGLGYDLLVQYVDPGQPRTTYYYRDLSQVLSRHEIQGGGQGLQYFHHYDGLGDVSAWTNQSGRAVQEYLYAPYGRLIDNNGPDNASNRTDPHTNLTWAGKPWDKETELNYFGARDYDSTAGVWTTQDPYRGQRPDPISLHRYQYVRNSPATWID